MSDPTIPAASRTPVEVIAAAVCSGPRFGGGPAPCEVCRGRAERDVAALAEGGYAIVSATAPQPSETLQDVRPVRDGMSGCSDDPKAVEGLSGLRHAEEPESAITRYLRASREET